MTPEPEEPTIDSDDVPVAGPDSEKVIDTGESTVEIGPKIAGECRILLMEDETIKVTFPHLGRWTPGRLEKAMNHIFRECILARQAFGRKADGLPETFNIGNEGQET